MKMFATLLLVFVQIVCGAHDPGGYNVCLYCPRVSHPRECQTFVEIWPEERCYTQRLLLTNGSQAYKFGHVTASLCSSSDLQEPSLDRRRRQSLRTDIIVCYDCCSESLCNRRICSIPESNNTNLACLSGEEVSGLPLDTSITYCNEGEYCYAGRTPLTRPHTQNYGCAPQIVCDQLARVSAGSSTMCQRCCSEDGCNAHICHEQVPETTTSPIDTTQSTPLFTDCWDLRTRGGYQETGVYDIYPSPGHSRLRVRCDMTTDGGGWTVLQRRFDGSLSFTRTFQEYEKGFGNVWGEHWVGLWWWIYLMKSQGAVQMRVDLCRVDDRAGYAVYDGFSVSGPGDNYTLHLGVYRTGSMRDWLSYHDGHVFQVSGSCADEYRGGWWYRSDYCFNANLNGGRYKGGSHHGIAWGGFGGYSSLPNVRSSELKIRPLNTPRDPTHPYTCPP